MPRSFRLVVRRSVPALRLWPGDVVRTLPDGSIEMRRVLRGVSPAILAAAEVRGDVRPVDPTQGRPGAHE